MSTTTEPRHAESSKPMSTPPSTESAPQTNDLRIDGVRPLISPALLCEELPLPADGARVVAGSRAAISDVLNGTDDRLLVVVGPCSIHDPAAALEYADRLREIATTHADRLHIAMRVYFEKPRTTLGWKGLINDPDLDGSYNVNSGLRKARQVLLDVLARGLPTAGEFLDPITPQYLADTVSWGAIGARTSESQVHRNLASGLSMPVGFKNSTSGDVQGAVDAVRAAAASHVFPGITPHGLAAILTTRGNPDCHVILRGGQSGTNYDATSVADVLDRLESAKLPRRVVIDASHGNSSKDHRRQPVVADDIAKQVAGGHRGIVGLMLESNLVEGRQDVELGRPEELTYGQSITDGCMGWDTTVEVLDRLADAVGQRRA